MKRKDAASTSRRGHLLTPVEAYSFSRLVERPNVDDEMKRRLLNNLKAPNLRKLAIDVIEHRDRSDLKTASPSVRAIVQELKAG